MTAQRIGVFTIDFPDPAAISYDNNDFKTLNDSISFQSIFPSNYIQTLSTKGVAPGANPYGLLYVPDLHSDGCTAQERIYVPASATRLNNLPVGQNYALIAVAPWYSPQCMIEYFTAARNAPTKGMFVYGPGQSNDQPPLLSDPFWNLSDGGAWQTANNFPTYALSPATGSIIMTQLGLYSGNLTDVPYGEQLARVFAPSDYVRLWATVNTEPGGQLPSLWVFLVIVMAILLIAVSVTSIAMHVIQRRRRRALRQRVIDGEVDLEALGVKRLTVSQHLLDKLPIYTYTAASDDPVKSPTHLPVQPLDPFFPENAGIGPKTSTPVRPSSAPTIPTAGMSTSWSQPTCPICLDDFEQNETQVRELPCRHVFHPDCIDTFLLRNSSLCPMCKQSVLPRGDCPVTITNMMVRRERHIARMQARTAHTTNAQPSAIQPRPTPVPLTLPVRPPGAFGSLGSRIGGALTGRRVFSAPVRMPSRPADIEMANSTTSLQPSEIPPPPLSLPPQIVETPSAPPSSQTATRDCEPSHTRREWARQRALALLGNRHNLPPPSDTQEREDSSRWRRGFRSVFPGFR